MTVSDAERTRRGRETALGAQRAVLAMLGEGLWAPQRAALLLRQWAAALESAEGTAPNPVWIHLVRAARAATRRDFPPEQQEAQR